MASRKEWFVGSGFTKVSAERLRKRIKGNDPFCGVCIRKTKKNNKVRYDLYQYKLKGRGR